MNIQNIMSKKIIIGKYNDSVKRISELMKENDIGFIPISKDKKIIGVITDRDIVIRALVTCAKCSSPIESYISPNVISCDVNSSIDDILIAMKESKIKRILISENERLVGVVSISDILDYKKTFEVMKEIYEVTKNDDGFKTEIDEFYL